MAKKAWSLVETFFPEFMFAAVPGIFIANGLCRDGPSIVNTLGEHHWYAKLSGYPDSRQSLVRTQGKGLFARDFTFIYSLYSNDSNPLANLIKVVRVIWMIMQFSVHGPFTKPSFNVIHNEFYINSKSANIKWLQHQMQHYKWLNYYKTDWMGEFN